MSRCSSNNIGNDTMKPKIDWEDLKERSLKPGGFGDDRVNIWTHLLHAKGEAKIPADISASSVDASPHHDERQIVLDTDRSFVLYPVDPKCDRDALQSGLHNLLVLLFRKRPRLHYFQGFHDIASVIFLTMPEDRHFPCIEKLSLHRLRDSMGTGLEPVLGLLRVTQNLLRLADRGYADVLERNSPLPFHALSNLLTLFSHDVPTLPLIQHIFDFLLSRPPIATVYLATAIILSRKQDVLRLEQEGDEGMIHSLLSGFPGISDESDPPTTNPGASITNSAMQDPSSDPRFIGDSPMFASENFQHPLPAPSLDPTTLDQHDREPSVPTSEKDDASYSSREVDPGTEPLDTSPQLDDDDDDQWLGSNYCLAPGEHNSDTNLECDELGTVVVTPPHGLAGTPSDPGCINTHKSEDSRSSQKDEDESIPLSSSGDAWPSATNGEAPIIHANPDDAKSDAPELNVPLEHLLQSQKKTDQKDDFERDGFPSALFLTELLKDADALYAKFPPSHEGLRLSSIMGPQSVVSTWSERVSDLPTDEEAEKMVQHLHLIVYPYRDMEEEEEESSDLGDEKAVSTTRHSLRNGSGKGKGKGRRRQGTSNKTKAKGLRLRPHSGKEKQVLVASAVLVVGVAVAVYGIKSRNDGSGAGSDLFRSFADMQGHAANDVQAKGWKDVGVWISDRMATVSEKVIHGFFSGGP